MIRYLPSLILTIALAVGDATFNLPVVAQSKSGWRKNAAVAARVTR